ncbi:GNAT family N-acetyltransferase [Marinicrinis sediminis]|uniref:GNAT family N-acetyltransferase n=1 Tax=Marinicrinis sediminis TaxID=1652465 RepID=A0ABW5R866_9BACL
MCAPVIYRVEEMTAHLEGLSDLLIQTVANGASIGFLHPLAESAAQQYWREVQNEAPIFLVAYMEQQLAGTVQVQLCMKENGRHRAEIAKLMTHPVYRRKGIGQLLMQHAEQLAREHHRSLLVLDTREGDPSNTLYKKMGYVEAGKIPDFALSSSGQLDATVIYYKLI